jgi:hypothetical protein
MNLAQLLSAPLPPIAELRGMWLVFPAPLKDALESAQDAGSNLIAIPLALTDGNYALCADLLTETQGVYAQAFANLDPVHFSAVEVLDDASFRALLIPPPEP